MTSSPNSPNEAGSLIFTGQPSGSGKPTSEHGGMNLAYAWLPWDMPAIIRRYPQCPMRWNVVNDPQSRKSLYLIPMQSTMFPDRHLNILRAF